MSRIFAATAILCATCSAPLFAATVKKINKEKDKILLELTQAELASLEDDEEVVIEFGKLRAITTGTLTKLNAVKKTVVLELEEPDPRFSNKQSVRFLSKLWNTSTSPLIQHYGQYHQFARSFAELGSGGFSTTRIEKDATSKQSTNGTGLKFQLGGYLLFSPEWFGAGSVIEHRSIKVQTKFETDSLVESNATTDTITVNRVRPGFWVGMPWGLRGHLQYEYSAIEDAGDDVTLNYQLEVPMVGVTYADDDDEWSIEYRDKDKAKAVADILQPGVGSVKVEGSLAYASEVNLAFRSISTPLFVWGLGLGYVFYEREKEGLGLERKPEIPEMLKAHASFEHRLDDGSKFDWTLFYGGSKSLGTSGFERGINAGGGAITYQMTVASIFLVGANMIGEYGQLTIKEDGAGVDPDTGEPISGDTKTQGYDMSMQMFLKFDFDLLEQRGRRR